MVSIWNSSKGARPQIRGPQCPVPKFQPGASWGRGTKAGRGARAERERVWKQFEAHLMAVQREGGAPTGGCSRGAPGSRFRGSGLAPDSAQSPPGSRPIESGFLGGNVDGAGAGPQAPPPSGGLIGGPCGRRGCGVPSPARPLGRRRVQCYSYYCTSLRYISFQNSTPRTHNALRLKGAAETSRQWGGG